MSIFIKPLVTVNQFELIMEAFLFIGIGVMIGNALYAYATYLLSKDFRKKIV
ncbi:MAG: hypothetical protein O2887_15420 [Bacteroidetes bacterium]|nr:hypothetical protein [Bacteroidota bacterium]